MLNTCSLWTRFVLKKQLTCQAVHIAKKNG
jgi:hypothetical protein